MSMDNDSAIPSDRMWCQHGVFLARKKGIAQDDCLQVAYTGIKQLYKLFLKKEMCY